MSDFSGIGAYNPNDLSNELASKVIPEGRLWKFQVMDIDGDCARCFGRLIEIALKREIRNTDKNYDTFGYISPREEALFKNFVSQLYSKLRGSAMKRIRKSKESKYKTLQNFERELDTGVIIKRSVIIKYWRLLEDLMTELGINDAEIAQHDVNTLFKRA